MKFGWFVGGEVRIVGHWGISLEQSEGVFLIFGFLVMLLLVWVRYTGLFWFGVSQLCELMEAKENLWKLICCRADFVHLLQSFPIL